MKLFIVESPAKCPLIRRYLPDGFQVVASVGHVRDLDKKELSIDVDNNYKPKWKTIPNKNNVIKMIKNAADKSSMIYLATDLDLEGESISWHLKDMLKIPNEKIRRVTFNQITKNAINDALKEADKKKSQIDMDKVNAQLARRMMDRLVGYKLSPCLWRHIGDSLSAGRVQSVALKLVVERENSIKNFKATSSFKINAFFVPNKLKSAKAIKFNLNREFQSQNDSTEYLNKMKESEFTIVDISEESSIKSPFPAFTTSTLQQTASAMIGMSPKSTMSYAQKLYEKGMITYMRTDSTSLSSGCVNAAKEYIIENFGEKYSHPRSANLQKNSQGAHEAIRPTKINNEKLEFEDEKMKSLYNLIKNRTLASQMAPSKYDDKIIKISPNDNRTDIFCCKVSTLVFDGFLKLSGKSKNDDDENETITDKKNLVKFKINNQVYPLQFIATEHFSHPKPRFTEASLVNAMSPPPNGIGIGRPSTYANILSNIIYKKYVGHDNFVHKGKKFITLKVGNLKDIVKKTNKITNNVSVSEDKEEKYRLFPTELGYKIVEFMEENFPKIMDYSFTSKMEDKLDLISEGKMAWQDSVDECYQSFISKVNNLMRSKVDEDSKVVRNKFIGKLKNTDKEIYAMIGRYGPVLRVGKGKSVKFYNLKTLKKEIQDITMKDAMNLINEN